MRIQKIKSVSIVVLCCLMFSILTSCGGGGGGGGGATTQSSTGVSAAKVTADTSIPTSSTQTAPVATIIDCNGIANLPSGYNIQYWGTKDSQGKALSITQSYIWRTNDPAKGIRTFFDANGLPVLIRDEVSLSTAEITWNTSSAKVVIKDSAGKMVSNLSLVKEGAVYVVRPSVSGQAVNGIDSSTISEGSQSVSGKSVNRLDPEAQNMMRAIAAGIVVESGKVALYGIAAGLFAPALLPAAVWVAGVPAVVGLLTYAGLSDAVLDAPDNIRGFFTNLKIEISVIISSVKDKISSWDSATTTDMADVSVDTTTATTSTDQLTTQTPPTTATNPTNPTNPTTPAAPAAQPVDCQVSAWSSWSVCSATCGGGTQTHTRTVITQPTNGGLACPALTEQQSCNTQVCASQGASYIFYPITAPVLPDNAKCDDTLVWYKIDCFKYLGVQWTLVDTNNPNWQLYYRAYKIAPGGNWTKSGNWTKFQFRNGSSTQMKFKATFQNIYTGYPLALGSGTWTEIIDPGEPPNDDGLTNTQTFDSSGITSVTITNN